MLGGIVRGLLVIAGLAVMVLGFLAIPGPDTGGALLLVSMGGGLVVVTVLERGRYRSGAAEKSAEAPGPGGGESGAVEARFEPTPEVFVDPTTGHRMRVLVDPRTGERRYVAEG
jgi:hypothetical protein